MIFRVRQYLSDTGVPFWTEGVNTSSGWTSVQCRMPGCGDRSNHGAFSPDGRAYTCFKCGTKRSFIDLISLYSEASYSTAKAIAAKYTSKLGIIEIPEIEGVQNIVWPPKGCEASLPEIHREYLKKRLYDPDSIQELYQIASMYQTGKFKYRILIPVFMGGRVVTYIGRDVTDQQLLRYKNLPISESVVPAKDCVYGIDNIGSKGIITEGIFDTWRFRFNAVAILGLVYTQRQIRLLTSKLKEAYICFDNEPQAQEKARDLAFELSMAGVNTEIVTIDQEDPGEMSQREADNLLQELFGGNYVSE